jgi:putative transposase
MPSGQVTRWQWKTERGARAVAVDMVRLGRRWRGQWHREVYAIFGPRLERGVRAYQRARFYRRLASKRFGIETSYRQLNQGKAVTTTKDPRRRLLWLGVGLLLRQVWVWCQRQLAPRGTRWQDWQPQEALRLEWLLQWLVKAIENHYPAPLNLPLPQPLMFPTMKTQAP